MGPAPPIIPTLGNRGLEVMIVVMGKQSLHENFKKNISRAECLETKNQ
jgi:hypothetical protein